MADLWIQTEKQSLGCHSSCLQGYTKISTTYRHSAPARVVVNNDNSSAEVLIEKDPMYFSKQGKISILNFVFVTMGMEPLTGLRVLSIRHVSEEDEHIELVQTISKSYCDFLMFLLFLIRLP